LRLSFLLASTLRPPTPTLFPYTTLFRSVWDTIATHSGGPYANIGDYSASYSGATDGMYRVVSRYPAQNAAAASGAVTYAAPKVRDRKSTRLNSSHQIISYAVFCLKKKKQ